VKHDGMPYGRIQGQGHSREVDRQSPTGLIFSLSLAGQVLFCKTWSCHARRHIDLEGHRNLSSTIYSFSVLCLEHHYCGDQQWRSLIFKI